MVYHYVLNRTIITRSNLVMDLRLDNTLSFAELQTFNNLKAINFYM